MNIGTLILYLFSKFQTGIWEFSIFVVIVLVMLRKSIYMSEFWNMVSNVLSLLGADRERIYEKVTGFINRYDNTPVYLGLKYFRILLIENPDDVKNVLNHFLEKPSWYKMFDNLSGEGLFVSPVAKWRKHRHIISPSFSRESLDKYVSQFRQKNQLIIDKLKSVADSNAEVDMKNYIFPASFEALINTVAGYKKPIFPEEIEEFEKSVTMIMLMDLRWWFYPWIISNTIFKFYYYKLKGYSKYMKTIMDLPRKIINHRAGTDLTEEIKGDFIQQMYKMNLNSGSITEQGILDEILNITIGGSDTQTLAVCFTMLMLAMHPEIQQKVRKEIDEVLGNTEPNYIKTEQLTSMVYLQQCIKETLRLFPPSIILGRTSTYELKLSTGFTIPKGTDILIPIAKIHRNPEFYPNPHVWNPDNFLPEKENVRHRYTFLGFSAGPRGCIGSRYGMLYMKSIIASILQNYTLTTDEKFEDIKLEMDVLIRSVHGYKMKLWRRKSYPIY